MQWKLSKSSLNEPPTKWQGLPLLFYVPSLFYEKKQRTHSSMTFSTILLEVSVLRQRFGAQFANCRLTCGWGPKTWGQELPTLWLTKGTKTGGEPGGWILRDTAGVEDSGGRRLVKLAHACTVRDKRHGALHKLISVINLLICLFSISENLIFSFFISLLSLHILSCGYFLFL